MPPINTEADPRMMVSGGPVQVAKSPTLAAGIPPINTVGAPGGRIGPPTCGTTSVTNGQVCIDRKSTRLNSSHVRISYAVFCLKKKKINQKQSPFMSNLSPDPPAPSQLSPPTPLLLRQSAGLSPSPPLPTHSPQRPLLLLCMFT